MDVETGEIIDVSELPAVRGIKEKSSVRLEIFVDDCWREPETVEEWRGAALTLALSKAVRGGLSAFLLNVPDRFLRPAGSA